MELEKREAKALVGRRARICNMLLHLGRLAAKAPAAKVAEDVTGLEVQLTSEELTFAVADELKDAAD
jgi:hypothetical protein